MARGDITAGEVFEDRQMLERLGYGIFDLAWGSGGGVGFENVRDFSYVVAEDKDPKIYRRRVFEMLGRYYNNDLAKAMWNKFIEHKWVLSERAGHEIDLKTAANDWFEKHGHSFLKDWVFRREEIPDRVRYYREPSKGVLGIVASYALPSLRDLLNAGFSVTDLAKAAVLSSVPKGKKRKPNENWRSRVLRIVPGHRHKARRAHEEDATLEDKEWQEDGQPYLLVKKVRPEDKGRFYMRMVANLTGHPIQDADEAEKRWREILEHKWYMSEREGHDVGIRTAALDYYRRLNLIEEAETGSET